MLELATLWYLKSPPQNFIRMNLYRRAVSRAAMYIGDPSWKEVWVQAHSHAIRQFSTNTGRRGF